MIDEHATPPPTAPLTTRPAPPPLRIHHLLAWTAVTAILLGTWFGSGKLVSLVTAWWIAAELPGIFGSSLSITIGLFGLCWRRQGLPFPSQPGHGLILIALFLWTIGLLVSLCLLPWSLTTSLVDSWPEWPRRLMTATMFLISFVGAGASAWFAYQFRQITRWQVFFALNAVAYLLPLVDRYLSVLVVSSIMNLEWIGPGLAWMMNFCIAKLPKIFPAVALAVVVAKDCREGVTFHWSHWCGVFAWSAQLPGPVVLALVNSGWLASPVLPG